MPSLSFDEDVFVWALAARPVDARRFRSFFKSEWLESVDLVPILNGIYSFVHKYGTSPSLTTLEKQFKEEDDQIYKLRIQEPLERLQTLTPDQSEILFVLDKAKDVAAIRSFQYLFKDEDIISSIEKVEGKKLLHTVYKWLNHFTDSSEEKTLTIKEAFEQLVSDSIESKFREKIPCGIDCLDKWSGGGLRSPQLGIIMTPTGQGKSATLLNIAYRVSEIENKKVWFVTNELNMMEQAERFLARYTGVSMSQIQNDPTAAYSKAIRHWNYRSSSNLRVTDVGLTHNTTMNDLEAILTRWTNLTGWKPDMLILDYMGRMTPIERGYSRDKEWQWYGGIASDIIKFLKRNEMSGWTACQTNRGGFNADSIDMSMGQASVRHFQEASVVVGAQQVTVVDNIDPDSPKKVGLQMKPLKARHSKLDNDTTTVIINLDTMLITNKKVEAASVETSSKEKKKEDKKSIEEATNAFAAKLKEKVASS